MTVRVAIALGAALTGCGPSAPPPRPQARNEQTSVLETTPHGGQLLAMARAASPSFVPSGELIEVFEDRTEIPLALASGHCYTVFGIGAQGVQNLDGILTDQSGHVLDRDRLSGPSVSMGIERAVCPPESTAAVLEVRRTGTGAAFLHLFEAE